MHVLQEHSYILGTRIAPKKKTGVGAVHCRAQAKTERE